MIAAQTSSNIQFREAAPGDLEEILRHRCGMFHDMGFTDENTLDAVAASSRDFIKRGLADGSYRGWFAVAENRVVAGAGLTITPSVSHPTSPHDARRAYVLNVYTYPDFRRLGLAKKLMQAVISH